MNWGALGWGIALAKLRQPRNPNDPNVGRPAPPPSVLRLSAIVTWFFVFLVVSTNRDDVASALRMDNGASWEIFYGLLAIIMVFSALNWIWSRRPKINQAWFLRLLTSVLPMTVTVMMVMYRGSL